MSDCLSPSDWCGAHSSRHDASAQQSVKRLLPTSAQDGPLESTPKAFSTFGVGKSRLCGCSGMRPSDTTSLDENELTYSPGVMVDDFNISKECDSFNPLDVNDTMSSRLELTPVVPYTRETEVTSEDDSTVPDRTAFTVRQHRSK